MKAIYELIYKDKIVIPDMVKFILIMGYMKHQCLCQLEPRNR